MSETTPETARPAPPPVEPLGLRQTMEKAMLDRVVGSATGDRKVQDARDAAKAFRADLLAFAGELAGPSPSPLVRALAFAAAVAYFDWVHAGFHDRGHHRDRAVERAERRFQRAAKTLNAVQRHMPESFMAIQIDMSGPR
ncbi:hypothetical protein [Tautonia plasticadhaerens]|uniref:Uncharacterized protein n=1 Tax=Tautonia plasticadhaerens TaxID=2527974 RepID=A0A518H1G7_9BACT|nr:hypothetical protein [Tautonia plasticadhaerens]QDV34678.1 hypothetical protein ElP_25720 [Tautonia plasticadhaerens]